jgi:hypothetical protein
MGRTRRKLERKVKDVIYNVEGPVMVDTVVNALFTPSEWATKSKRSEERIAEERKNFKKRVDYILRKLAGKTSTRVYSPPLEAVLVHSGKGKKNRLVNAYVLTDEARKNMTNAKAEKKAEKDRNTAEFNAVKEALGDIDFKGCFETDDSARYSLLEITFTEEAYEEFEALAKKAENKAEKKVGEIKEYGMGTRVIRSMAREYLAKKVANL